jgi:HAMP domain-containing protein
MLSVSVLLRREPFCPLKRDLELRGKGSAQNLSNLKRARQDFGAMMAIAVTEDAIDTYIARRLKAGAAPASVNRVTQLLGQAFQAGHPPAAAHHGALYPASVGEGKRAGGIFRLRRI